MAIKFLNTTTAATQAVGDNSTKIATTAYADAAAGAVDPSGNYLPLAGGTMTGNLNLTYAYPRINLTDTNNDSDYSIINNDGSFGIYDVTNNSYRLSISAAGNATFAGNINTGAAKYLRFNSAASGSDAAILFGNTSGTGGGLTFKRNSDSAAILTLNGDKNATFAGDITVSGGDITLGGTGRIQGVDTVSASTDAANKAYVDAHGGGLGPFLPLGGGTMTGSIAMSNQNITGVNQITINDPGEGIVFTGTTNVNLYVQDDLIDSIVNFDNASEIRRDGVRVADVPYIASRSQQLLTNYNGLLGNNYNFPGYTFDGQEANYSPGSFKFVGSSGNSFTSEYMAVDTAYKYKMSLDAKTLNGVGRYYCMTLCYDVDQNQIGAINHMYRANTSTTLAVALNPGDTTVTLAGTGSNWYDGGTAGVSTHLRSLIIWEYTNSYGYTYPPETYSRLWYNNAWDPNNINGNVITLRTAWTGPSYPVGTRLSNGSAGGSYKYNVMSNTLLTTDWVQYSGFMDGVDLSGTNISTKFPPGTAQIKMGFLMNYGSGSTGADTIWITNFNVGIDTVLTKGTQSIAGAKTFTTTPISVTRSTADNSTYLATTAFVKNQGYVTGSYLPLAGGTMDNTNLVTNMNADLLDGQQGSYYVNTTTAQSVAGVKSFSGKIGADGGIDGLTLANGGITGSNYNITGVNQLTIADPGEGIVFTGTATMYLNAVDDATDSILKLTNATQLNLNSTARITSLVNPTGAQDAATKNYVDTEVGNIPSGLAFEGNWNASTDTPALAGTTQDNGKFWIVSVAGSTNLSGITDWAVGDWAIYVDNGAGTDAWQKVDNSSSLAGAGSAGKVTFWSSTSNVSFNNNFTYDGTYLTAPRMRVGDGTDGYFYSDSAGRTAFAGGNFYIQDTVGTYYNYATNQYHGNSSGDNHYFRSNQLVGTNWDIDSSGNAEFLALAGTSGTFSGEVLANGGLKVVGPGSYNTFKSGNDYTLGFLDSAGTTQWWIKAYTNGDFALHENGAGDKFTIEAGGNVGIGRTNPAVPLDVEGKIRSNDDNSADYLEIFCDGSVSGDSYIQNTNNNIQIKSANATSFSTSGSVAMFIDSTRSIQFNEYSGTNKTGTPTYLLGTDASGNVVKTLSTPGGIPGQYNSKSKYYNSLTGSSGDWFDLFQVTDSMGPVNVKMFTYAHDALEFSVTEGYGPSNAGSITIINSVHTSNGGFATVSAVRIDQNGYVEVKLVWTSGPSVQVGVIIEGYNVPNLTAALTTSPFTTTIVDSISVDVTGILRSKRQLIIGGSSSNLVANTVKLTNIGDSYISGNSGDNFGIGTASPGAKLTVAGDVLINSGEYISWGTVGATSIEGSTASNKLQFRTNSSSRMIIDSAGAIQFNSYNSTNNTGTPTYLLGTDASGNVVKTASSPGTSTATSLYDLIPNGAFTTTYAFTSTAGVYAEVMESNDVITSTGTYSVQMVVNDYAVGGTQYDEKYSGVMSWHATSTNDAGGEAVSEIVLHRAGHAANSGIIYLRTRETTSAETNRLKLEIMCNKTYTGASNVIFKFVKLI